MNHQKNYRFSENESLCLQSSTKVLSEALLVCPCVQHLKVHVVADLGGVSVRYCAICDITKGRFLFNYICMESSASKKQWRLDLPLFWGRL